MKIKLKQVVFGTATFIPGVYNLRARSTHTGGTDSARYCYSVWMRHLVITKNSGLNPYPNIVGELGPGDSLGIGLAALLTGCEKYFAFDVVKHANTETNLKIFNELIELFNDRTDIPGDDEFPDVHPQLDNYTFPDDILDEPRLRIALKPSRLAEIREALINLENNALIQYKVPWYDASVLEKESVDMIYSQAVLEHVNDLDNTYESMYLWLKPTGHISHQIDFKSHGTAHKWNGHWMYSDFIWKLIKGKRPYLLNRAPHSTHLKILQAVGFDIISDKKVKSNSDYTIDELAPRFRSIPDDDLTTSGACIQAVKK